MKEAFNIISFVIDFLCKTEKSGSLAKKSTVNHSSRIQIAHNGRLDSPMLHFRLPYMLELHKHGLAYSTRAEVFEPLLGEAFP